MVKKKYYKITGNINCTGTVVKSQIIWDHQTKTENKVFLKIRFNDFVKFLLTKNK